MTIPEHLTFLKETLEETHHCGWTHKSYSALSSVAAVKAALAAAQEQISALEGELDAYYQEFPKPA